MPTPSPRPLVQVLLARLQLEESVLQTTRQTAMRLYTALRKGNLPEVESLRPEYEQAADGLKAQAAIREAAAAELAGALGLSATASLTELAAPLSPPLAEAVLAARDRLRGLTSQVEQFQSANANLISHLRSYFRGVLDGLADEPPPPRYGPTGAAVTGPAAPALHATG